MQFVLNSFIVFCHSLVAFIFLYGFFLIAKDWPRWIFTVTHWLVVALIFFLVYWFYANFFNNFSAFQVMAIAMISIFMIEFVVYMFLAKSELWFLNFYDYIVSIFIAATVIYWTIVYFTNK